MFKGWLFQSLASTFLIVPAWLAVDFFAKNFKMRAEVFLLYYFLGTLIGAGVWKAITRPSDLVHSWSIALAVVLIGISFGAACNVLMYQAIASAPNPGLPIAIIEGASVLVFLGALLLGSILPMYFSPSTFDLQQLFGILLVISGVVIIGLR